MSELSYIRPHWAFIFYLAGCGLHCAEDSSSTDAMVAVDAFLGESEEAIDARSEAEEDTAESVRMDDPDDTVLASADGGVEADVEPYVPPVFGGAPQLGVDGDVAYEVLLAHPWIWDPTDVAFDPNHPERMWVTSRADDAFVLLDGPDSLPQKFVDYYHALYMARINLPSKPW